MLYSIFWDKAYFLTPTSNLKVVLLRKIHGSITNLVGETKECNYNHKRSQKKS